MEQYFVIFQRAFNFIFSFLNRDILGTYSILDVMGFGIVGMGIVRMIILPIFGKFGSFASSSTVRSKVKSKNSED